MALNPFRYALAALAVLPFAASAAKFEPAALEDVNPNPDVVEVFLEAEVAKARFGRGPRTAVWTYNGITPGPTINAKVGDTIIVHFTNSLPEDTTVHWHGVETPATMDGSNISQLTVPSGGYFRYEFTALTAATTWYHPHVRSSEQVEKGLYGTLVIRDPDQDAALGLPNQDTVVMLDDVLLDDSGAIAGPRPDNDPLANAKRQLDGREGNTLLVNGRSDRTLRVQIGQPQRWRLVNTANARFMRVSIPGQQVWRIGGDGGLLERPVMVPPVALITDPEDPDALISDPDPEQGLLLTPGERADIVFTPSGRPGQVIEVEWHDFPRGRHGPFYRPDGSIGLTDDPQDGKLPPETLFRLRLLPKTGRGTPEYRLPATLRTIEPIDVSGAEPLTVTFGHAPPDANGDVTFFATRNNGMPIPFAKLTPEDAQDVTVGDIRIWEVTNLTGAAHPFHVHGWFFQPLEIQYIDMDNPANNRTVPFPHLENKDTVMLPGRPGALMRSRTVLRAAVYFDDSGREGQVAASGKQPDAASSGGWLAHCHILEHSVGGMMSFFEVFY